MTRTLLMLGSLSTLLVVTLAILIALSDGLRRHRIGVTLLASWASFGISIYSLRAIGDALPLDLYFGWFAPLGCILAAWALWDVSRLSRHYGTTTMMQAAELARGFLLGDKASEAIWAKWADHLPTAAWLKAPGGVMVAINRHYEARYGTTEKSYVGGRDRDVWVSSIADQYEGNDREVFELGKPIVVKEHAPMWHNEKREAMILKFPVRDRRGSIVGVGGIELMVDPSNAHAIQHDEHEDGGP